MALRVEKQYPPQCFDLLQLPKDFTLKIFQTLILQDTDIPADVCREIAILREDPFLYKLRLEKFREIFGSHFVTKDPTKSPKELYQRSSYKVIRAIKKINGASFLATLHRTHPSKDTQTLLLMKEYLDTEKENENFIRFCQKLFRNTPSTLAASKQKQLIFFKEWFNNHKSKFAQMQTLSMKDANLQQLPKEIVFFKNLQSLDLYENHLTSLPSELGSLSRLETLNLSRNQFKTFPTVVCNLRGLRSLDITNNLLTTLPTEIELLTNLVVLALSVNRLVCLPHSLYNLTSLQRLDLSSNRLTPKAFEGIDKLKALTTVSIKKNNLKKIPSFLLHL
jgi:hypothetical protein